MKLSSSKIKKILIFQEMELSSPKFKKFLIFFLKKVFLVFQEGTCTPGKTKKCYISLKKSSLTF